MTANELTNLIDMMRDKKVAYLKFDNVELSLFPVADEVDWPIEDQVKTPPPRGFGATYFTRNK